MSEAVSIEKSSRLTNKGYIQVAANLAGLVDTLKLIYHIQPGYYLTWSLIKKRLLRHIEDVFRDRGAVGLARAMQIEKFCTKIIFKFFSGMLSRRHFSLFLFIHSLREYLSTSKRMPETILFNLLHQSLTINEYQVTNNPQPTYLSTNSWLSLLKFEKQAPEVFTKLSQSMIKNANKWTEYFHIEDLSEKGTQTDLTEKEIDLLNDMPSDQASLDIVQKLILWLTIRQDKTSEILNKYNVYNYGGLISPRGELDLDEAFKISAPHLPILVNVIKGENSFVSVTSSIVAYAKETQAKLHKVAIVSLDNSSNVKFDRLGKALKEAIKVGSWVIVENAHHIIEWPREILNLFYRIKDSFKFHEEQELSKDYRINIDQQVAIESTEIVKLPGIKKTVYGEAMLIHRNFRLWIVSESDMLRSLQTSLVYDAVKVSPQLSDLGQTYQSCRNLARLYEPTDSSSNHRFEDASVLHAVMTHNEFLDGVRWELKDLLDYMRFLADVDIFDSDEIYERILDEAVYGPRLTNKVDKMFAKKLIQQVAVQKRYDMAQFVENSHKFYSKIERSVESAMLVVEMRALFGVEKARAELYEIKGSNLERLFKF